MIIKERQNKYIPGGTSLFLSFNFNQKIIDAIKATHYYHYDKKTHEWEVPLTSLSQIVDSVCYYDDITLDLLGEAAAGNEDLRCQSKYRSKPFDYQLDGIRYGLNHDKFLLLDVAGLGKSLQMIYLAEELKAREGLKHCLIICGINTLKSNWEKEIKKHSNLDCVVIGKKVASTGRVSYAPIPDRCTQIKNKIDEFFIIVNIETLRSPEFVGALRTSQNEIDMVVFDEMHKCLDYDTEISTDVGKIKIGEIVSNKVKCNVLSFNSVTGLYEFVPIVNFHQKWAKTTLQLTIEDCSGTHQLRCTPDHLIYTRNRGWVEAQNLTSEDDIEIKNI